METEKVLLELVQVKSVRTLQVKNEKGEWERKIGAIYFHRISNGHFVFHIISEQTDGAWLIDQRKKGNLYVPKEEITAEKS